MADDGKQHDRIVVTSPHGDHLDVPDCTLPHLLLHLDSKEEAERLRKPIFYPSPTAERALARKKDGGNGLLENIKDKLHIGSSSSSSNGPTKDAEKEKHKLGYDTAAPLSMLQIRDMAERIAISLLTNSYSPLEAPWQPGTVVAFFSVNQHDYCAAVLGVQMAGGIAALCNPAYKPRELAQQLRMTRAKLIIAGADSVDAARKAAQLAARRAPDDGTTEEDADLEPLSSEPPVLVFEEQHEASYTRALLHPPPPAWQAKEETLAAAQTKIRPARDTAVICFSSGTSGLPKALALTHRNLVANVLQFWTLMVDEFEPPVTASTLPNSVSPSQAQASRDKHQPAHYHIDFLPCFHAYGLQCQFVALYSATPRLVLQRFKLDVFLQVVQEHKATFAFVVPPICESSQGIPWGNLNTDVNATGSATVLALAKSPEVDKYDLSSMKHVASGAATLSQELARQVKERLGIITTDGFGLSEMSPIVCLQNVQDALESPDSVGFLAPGTRARIIGGNGQDLPHGEEGELYLQGPQMMEGYLNNDEGNRAAFTTANRHDADCWLRSGDVAKATREGRICITGRTKDIIKCKGFQVSPKELEDLLYKRSAVEDVAVVGAKDDEGNEVPWAFVVASKDVAEQPEEERTKALLAEINGMVAGYKKVRGITWLSALPKSASGKVLKRELRT